MNRSLLAVTIVASLAAAAGCGARSARSSAVPASGAVAEVSTNDPSWCPPGEDFTFNAQSADQPTVKKDEGPTEMKPNAPERPTQGAVHAAVY